MIWMIYKIAKIAWEYVNIVVMSRCFEEDFLVENSTSLLYLPIPLSAETWKIFTNMLCQFFSA